jgi:hypothetical protein
MEGNEEVKEEKVENYIKKDSREDRKKKRGKTEEIIEPKRYENKNEETKNVDNKDSSGKGRKRRGEVQGDSTSSSPVRKSSKRK